MEDIRTTLAALLAGDQLSAAQAESVFEQMFSGQLDDAQIGAFLALIQQRGVTIDELVGAASVMRRHVTRVPVEIPPGGTIIDTCGTGGAPKTFNVSTAAAIIVAAATEPAKLMVAKHGNRSRTGRGSAEVLMSLGINVDAAPEVQATCLTETGVCFCFAIHHHPATKHAIGPRKALGFPTMFNLLGPLTNPAAAPRQLIGIYDPNRVEDMGQALARLGAEHAMVVHGDDGLDEISLTAPTTVAHVRDGNVSIERIDPERYGLTRCTLPELQVATLEEGADVIRAILDGEPGPKLDMALLNSAAALFVGGVTESVQAGLEIARESVTNGAAKTRLARLGEVSNA